MFYAHLILAKKGPLARVWLAAHWDKKITKAHVFETNIEKSVEGIMQPKVKLALRTSGHLLLGVVRIYSRKAKYLLADCNEAFVKIKMAFRPGMVDLPEGHREANVNAITLPEVFHDFDTALPELNDIDIEAQFSINQSRADEITMREDYGSLSLSLHDDGFGDMGFDGDTPDLIRGALDSNINDQLFENEIAVDVNVTDERIITSHEAEISNSRLDGDGFGDEFGQPELFEDDFFGEAPLDEIEGKDKAVTKCQEELDDDAVEHLDARAPSPESFCQDSQLHIENEDNVPKSDVPEATRETKSQENQLDQSTLLQNEDESFALAPIDASAYRGVPKTKRKRKLIVDEVKNISGEEMKAQLANTSDIVTTLDLAPPTKRLMYWKETGGVEKLFSLPSRSIPARTLFANYHRHLLSHFTQLEDFSCLGPSDLLALEHIHNENESPSLINNKRGRKRKHDLQTTQQNPLESTIDGTTQSLAFPELARNIEASLVHSRVSLTTDHESCAPLTEGPIFENIRSPGAILNINDINVLDNLNTLTDIPLTSGNLHHNIDVSDDFNQGDLTPAGLHHGQHTPHHSGIESIPNLLDDHITSILHETENMPDLNEPPTSYIQPACEIASEWNDCDLGTSIVQNPAEEQMENETNEQFEERVLNKRAAQLFYTVKSRIVKQEYLYLSELTINNSRKQAAQKFYSLLVLKKFRALDISQTTSYSDIGIARGPLFENPKL